MNSFLDQLVGDTGCSLEATTSNNPLGQWATRIIESSVGLDDSQYSVDNATSQQYSYSNADYDIVSSSSVANASFQSQGRDQQLDSLWEKNMHINGAIDKAESYNGQYQSYGGNALAMQSMGMMGSMNSMGMFGGSRFMMGNRDGQMQSFNSTSSSTQEKVSSSSSSSSMVDTSTTKMKDISIDELLEESANAGLISKAELEKIHRVIGFDQYDSNLTSIKSGQEVADPTLIAKAMDTTLPSKLGYNQAWEKLSNHLESLDNLRNIVPFASQELNPYMTASTFETNTAEEILSISKGLFEDGDLKNAILASEADVQKFPEHSEGWRMLGVCYAENEDDKKALYCLKKAVDLDPFNLEAQLALGTSYVNEMNTLGALTALKHWITHHALFQDVNIKIDEYSDGTLMDDIMQLMLSALQLDPLNADVNIVLGVLYNVSLDYTSAAQHFEKALESRPHDYGLLNKLGATLANSKQSAEATQYYARALQIRPTYVRGWVNLGIAYFNMGDNVMLKETVTEAAKAFIQALNLAPDAEHVWGYLRMALTSIDKLELVEITSKENIQSVQILANELGIDLIHQKNEN